MQKRLVLILSLLLACSSIMFAQATATVNGRVSDPGGAVVPDASVTVTNVGSGAVRQTATNADGLYTVPALTPGNYNVKVEKQGFSAAERNNVEVLVGADLSVDFQMAVGAVSTTVAVEAQAELIETTQGTIAGSIRTQEVQELPMLNRSLGALMTLTPGAREVTGSTSSHGASSNFVSFGGGQGGNYNMLVDGLDNKEDHCGGTEIQYSLEGIQEFKTMDTGSAAEYGKATATIILATKSGTNQVRGTLFYYGRNQDLVRTDYFSDPKHGGLGKPPFSRQQFGGSVGGPIKKDKFWYFGSVEKTLQNFQVPRTGTVINQLTALATNLNSGSYPPLGLAIGGAVPQPSADLLIQAKVNYQLNAANTIFLRYSSENGYVNNDFFSGSTGLLAWAPTASDQNLQKLYGGAMGETWVINSRMVNQFTAGWLGFEHDNKFPVCPYNVPSLGIDSCLSEKLSFPSESAGPANALPDFTNIEKKWEFKEDLSVQLGRNAMKFGVDYSYIPVFGGVFGSASPGSIVFFADPLTIINNTNGLYPQGFQTPGILQSITETSTAGGTYWSSDNYEIGGYAQDDFRVSKKLTLNLGLRYNTYNLFNTQANLATNRVYQILKTIGSPYGQLPQLPRNDWEPRVGFAYDLKGDGKDVFRGSFGVFSVPQLKNTTFYEENEQQPYVLFPQKLTNTAVGVGQLANFIYGVTPLPSIPVSVLNGQLPPNGNTTGYWYDPKNFKNAMTYQWHVGWAHQLGATGVVAVDHTFILGEHGWRWDDVNPLIGGVRPLAATLTAAYGGQILGNILMDQSVDRSIYDETLIHFEKRYSTRASLQVNYVLAWSQGMGGVADGTLKQNPVYPQLPSTTGGYIYKPWEWGPTGYDERHRVTAIGVFSLPFKLQVSPSMTFATPRPYTLNQAINPSGEGGGQQIQFNGVPIGINTERGQSLFMLNTRVTRIFRIKERFSIAAFAELYNLTDRPNFGNKYGGATYAPSTFEKPTSYLGGIGSVSSIPNSFQVQFGARFSF